MKELSLKPRYTAFLFVCGIALLLTRYFTEAHGYDAELGNLAWGYGASLMMIAVVFGVISPCLSWLSARSLLHVEIGKNSIIVDGVALKENFSSDSLLVASPTTLDQALYRAVDQALGQRWLRLRPTASVVVRPVTSGALSDLEATALLGVLNGIFINYSVQMASLDSGQD